MNLETGLQTFSSAFEPDLISEMAKCAKLAPVPAGENLIQPGEVVKFIPLLLEGLIKISRTDESGREVLLYYIAPKQSCAMTFTCCMQEQPSEILATTEEDSTLMLIPISVMSQWLTQYPTWKSFVMLTIKNRFNELLKTVDLIAFQKLDERLIHYLKEKYQLAQSRLINISHEQIARDMASTREVISRLLKKLETDGRLLLYRNQIKLLGEW